MFTGIIQHCGTVSEVRPTPTGSRLIIDAGGWDFVPSLGDSIAVNGCCLTVAEGKDAPDSCIHFDVIHQTLRVTSLGQLRAGHRVNLEHAVTASTLMSGHLVQGHVDDLGRVVAVHTAEGERRIRLAPPPSLMPYMVRRGSVAIDGVSLTIAEMDRDWIEVALIPTTLDLTNLADRAEGDSVNLEADYFARVVVNWLEQREASQSADAQAAVD